MSKKDSPLLLAERAKALIPAKTSAPSKHHILSDRLKRLGFANTNRMRLYGEEFELLSDPIVVADDVVFFDAIEKKSRQTRRVRIPLTIVHMANAERQAA